MINSKNERGRICNIYQIIVRRVIIDTEIKQINELGMITIPINIREKLGIKYKDKLEMNLVKDEIILKKITKENDSKIQNSIRVIDELGRIVILLKIREQLKIAEGEKFEVSIRDDNVVLRRTN